MTAGLLALHLLVSGGLAAAPDDDPLARARQDLAAGRYEAALERADALASAAPMSDKRTHSRVLTLRSAVLADRGQLERAQGAIDTALRLLADTSHVDMLVEILLAAGDLRERRGDLNEARRLFSEAAAWNDTLSGRPLPPSVLLARARLAFRAAEDEAGSRLVESARRGCGADPGCVARTQLTEARGALARGDEEAARRLARVAERTFGDLGAERDRCDAMASLAEIELQAGDEERAEVAAAKAVALAERLGYRARAAELQRLQGVLALERGALGPAEEHLGAARKALVAMGSRPGVARTRLALARLATLRGLPEEARIHLAAARRIFREMGDRAGETDASLQIARWNREHAPNEELASLQALVASAGRSAPWRAVARLGELVRTSDPARAVELLIRAVGKAEAEGERLVTVAGREEALSARQRAYDVLVETLLEPGPEDPERTALALEFSERAVARAFLDLVERAEIRESAPQVSRDLAELERLAARERALLRRLAGRTDAAAERLLSRVERARLEVEARVWAEYPAALAPSLGGWRRRIVRHVERARDRLEHDVALVKFHLGVEHAFAFVVTDAGVSTIRLGPRAEIARHAIGFHELLDRPLRTTAEVRKLRKAARSLYDQVLGPLAGALGGRRRLVLVPHAELRAVPFDALIAPDGRWAIERYTISYSPSIAALSELNQDGQRRRLRTDRHPIVAFGDPRYVPPHSLKGKIPRLKWSGAEARTAGRHLDAGGGPGTLYLRDQASESNLKRLALERYRTIHLATHAFADDDVSSTRQPTLILAPGDGDDGLLRMEEVLGLELDADLVVLSACSSGKGPLTRGDGLGGLTRAFLYAGSSAVLATLWAVEDAHAATLMDVFYRELAKGRRSPDALRTARLALIHGEGVESAGATRGIGGIIDPDGKRKKGPRRRTSKRKPRSGDPFFWASYLLVGEVGDVLR